MSPKASSTVFLINWQKVTPNLMENKTEHQPSILDQFTPKVLGVLWFTNEELSSGLLGFDDLNYLFDGLISQYIYSQDKGDVRPAHIFFTKNFNEKIFLTHLKTLNLNKDKIVENIHENMVLIEGNHKETNQDRKQILVFDKTNYHLTEELKRSYPHFEFQSLNVH